MLIEAVLGAVWLSATTGATMAGRPDAAPQQATQQTPGKPSTGDKAQKPKKKKAKNPKPSPDEEVDETDAPPAEAPRTFRAEWKQHPSIRIGSFFRADFQAQFQEDIHASYAGASTLNKDFKTFDLHRNRVGIKGNFFKHVQYEVKRELTEKEVDATTQEKCAIDPTVKGCQIQSLWKDVYVNLTYLKRAQLQVGKFKVPFGLDQLTGVTHLDFVYRSLGAKQLAPARDIGAQLHGQLFKKSLEYAAGVFRHDGENAHSSKIAGGDLTGAGRVSVQPFRKSTVAGISALQFGAAAAISKLSDDSYRPNGLQGKTVMTGDTFYHPVFVKGRRHRWEGDVDWTAGRYSARSEFTLVRDDRLQQGLIEDDLPDSRARSWYVSGTVVVTGEAKTRPIKPNGDLFQGGIGAIELAARYERLWFDSVGGTDVPTRANRAETILESGDKVLTLGVNWTVNRFVKLQFNGIREQIEDLGRNPVPKNTTGVFWSRVLRLQFVL